MNDTTYLKHVNALLKSSEARADLVQKIRNLQLPEIDNPLVALIHGDSKHLEFATKYAQINDPANPSDEEINSMREELATETLGKINKYLADYNSGNLYHYSFSLAATYGAFKNERGDVEYVTVTNRNEYIKTKKLDIS